MLIGFSLLFSLKDTAEFSRGYRTCDGSITLTVNEVWAYVFACFKFFSVLISNLVNVDRYSPQKLKLSSVLHNFYDKGAWKPNSLRTTALRVQKPQVNNQKWYSILKCLQVVKFMASGSGYFLVPGLGHVFRRAYHFLLGKWIKAGKTLSSNCFLGKFHLPMPEFSKEYKCLNPWK